MQYAIFFKKLPPKLGAYAHQGRGGLKTLAANLRNGHLERDGWYLARTRGSHRQFRHPTKKGLVTIAGKPNDDVAPGALNSILKQAGLKT